MGREKFPTAKREQKERERLEKIELIFGIISICRNEGSLSSPSPQKKKKGKKKAVVSLRPGITTQRQALPPL